MAAYNMRDQVQKGERQRQLLKIVEATPIARQDELVSLLQKKGFVVTQASVSRDLDELGVSKRNGVYRKLETASDPPFGQVSLNAAGANLIVARCASGFASALAVKIDAARIDGVVGSVAGDDTVFIAVTKMAKATRKLEAILG